MKIGLTQRRQHSLFSHLQENQEITSLWDSYPEEPENHKSLEYLSRGTRNSQVSGISIQWNQEITSLWNIYPEEPGNHKSLAGKKNQEITSLRQARPLELEWQEDYRM